MVSQRAINDTVQTPKKYFLLLSLSHCFQLLLTINNKNQKSCVKRIHLVTDDGLCNRKAFYTVKIVFFYSSSMNDDEMTITYS